jgi:hypothetical protein
MKLDDFSNSKIVEAQMVWKRKGNSLARKFRCSVGARAGRIVSDPSQCSKPINIAKRMSLAKTKAKMGGRLSMKAARTKKFNVASKLAKSMNKPVKIKIPNPGKMTGLKKLK